MPGKSKVFKRLMPIYVAFFFKGLIFWYAIEKLFMTEIGFGPSEIALVSIVMVVTGLLLEIPFGVLADRWSRKGVMILSVFILGLASLTLGLSDTVLEYTLASIFFGLYIAMFSGTVESIVYDTLLEENSSRKGYEKYYGYTNLVMSVSLIIGSIIGGLIATSISLQATYLLTLPTTFISIILLFFLREPKLHKHHKDIKLIKHTRDTLKLLMKKGTVAWLITSIMAVFVLLEILYEMDQLWPIALAMPLVLYGPVNALFLAGYGLGGPLAEYILKKRIYIWTTLLFMMATVSLLSVKNLALSITMLTVSFILLEAVYVIGIGKLNDEVPSRYRSGAVSAVSTLGNIAIAPSILAFGYLAEKYSIFSASYMMIPFGVVASIALIYAMKKRPSQLIVNS